MARGLLSSSLCLDIHVSNMNIRHLLLRLIRRFLAFVHSLFSIWGQRQYSRTNCSGHDKTSPGAALGMQVKARTSSTALSTNTRKKDLHIFCHSAIDVCQQWLSNLNSGENLKT